MAWFKRITLMLLPLFLLLIATLYMTFSLPFYQEQFLLNDSVAATGVSAVELRHVAQEMIKYLAGLRPDLVFMVTDLAGQTYQAFEGRELAHMVDVRHIFDFIRLFVSFYPFILGLVVVREIKYKRGSALLKSCAQAILYPSLILLALLFVAMQVDFSSAFILFHHLLFRNDLWLLDPATDLLIQMLPEVFFITIAQRILIIFSTFVALSGLLLVYIKVRR